MVRLLACFSIHSVVSFYRRSESSRAVLETHGAAHQGTNEYSCIRKRVMMCSISSFMVFYFGGGLSLLIMTVRTYFASILRI